MIEKFQYYIDNNLVRRGTPNKAEARALLERALARYTYICSQKITENSAPFIFEGIYEVIREAAQALMELKGYKPYSHEAVISFLREFFHFHLQDISSFDRYRILRNKVVYRAEGVDSDSCKSSLEFVEHFLPELKAEFERLEK